MKINPTTNKQFMNINEGEVFKFCDSFYIKTQFTEIKDGWVNAINLYDGALSSFNENVEVVWYPNASINLV